MRHHLVVLHSGYLKLLVSGRKRIECRLSSVRRAPFRAVAPCDLLWLKVPSRPILAIASVGRCSFRELDRGGLAGLEQEYRDEICAESGFFEEAERWARYCSLIWIRTVVAVRPLRFFKSDMRSWVVLDEVPRPGMRLMPRRCETS